MQLKVVTHLPLVATDVPEIAKDASSGRVIKAALDTADL
jgi:hypothetical protein